jgi:hypothetical protein
MNNEYAAQAARHAAAILPRAETLLADAQSVDAAEYRQDCRNSGTGRYMR